MIVRSVRHALLGREPSDVSSRGPWPRLASLVYHSRAYRLAYLAAGWAAVVLLPTWEAPVVYSVGNELSASSIAGLRAADALWLTLCGFDLCLQTVLIGQHRAMRRGWLWVKFISLCIIACNGLASAVSGAPYIMRLLRPILLVERMRNVRKLMTTIVSTAPRVLSVALIMAINLLLHSTLGYVLFAGIDGTQCKPFRATDTLTCSTMLSPPQSCNSYFSTLGETLIHMFELTTAVNFPSIALPVIRCNEYYMLFFISYIVTGSYLLFNLALVVAYSEFYTGLRTESITRIERVCRGLELAFDALVTRQDGAADTTEVAVGSTPTPSSPNFQPVVAWGEKKTASALSADDAELKPARRRILQREEFIRFIIRLKRNQSKESTENVKEFGVLAYDAFATEPAAAVDGERSDGGTGSPRRLLNCNDFKRLMITFGPLTFSRDVSQADIEDTLAQQDEHEIEAMFIPGPAAVGESDDAAADIVAPAAVGGVIVANPLAAALSSGAPESRADAAASASPLDEARRMSVSSSSKSTRSAATANGDAGPGHLLSAAHIAVLRGVSEGILLSRLFDAATLLGALCSLVQLSLETDEMASTTTATVGHLVNAQTASTVLCAVCLSVRISAWGFKRYIRRSQLNRFDFLSIGIAVTEAVVTLSGKLPRAALVPTVFFRILRLARVCAFIPGFSSTLGSFWMILPVISQHVLVLLVVLYMFAIVGLHSFAGALNRVPAGTVCGSGNALPACAVQASAYGVYGYYDMIDFNSFPHAIFATFYVLGVNDWNVLMEGCVAATGKIARLYFIVFWPVLVLFLLNVVIAFITVAFSAEKDRRDAVKAFSRVEKNEAATRPTAAILNWRDAVERAGFKGWLVRRQPRVVDIYDDLYRVDIISTFPETFKEPDYKQMRR